MLGDYTSVKFKKRLLLSSAHYSSTVSHDMSSETKLPRYVVNGHSAVIVSVRVSLKPARLGAWSQLIALIPAAAGIAIGSAVQSEEACMVLSQDRRSRMALTASRRISCMTAAIKDPIIRTREMKATPPARSTQGTAELSTTFSRTCDVLWTR